MLFAVAPHDPDDESYCGPNAFSEKESLAWSNYIKFIGDGVEYYFAFHSYSQFMIMPYGSSKHHLDNYDEVVSIRVKLLIIYVAIWMIWLYGEIVTSTIISPAV